MEGAKANKLKPAYIPLFALIALYLVLGFYAPIDQATLAHYGITANQLRLIGLAIALPLFAIWFIAFYGYVHFREYARLIKKSVEGGAYAKLAAGLGILAYGLPLGAIIGSSLQYITHLRPGFLPVETILYNYISIAIALSGFFILYQGARLLIANAPKALSNTHYTSFLLAFVVLGAGYCYLVLTNPFRTASADPIHPPIYHLPDWLIIFTIILPYLITWFLCLRTALYIYHYHSAVKGILYKQALLYLSAGLCAVILGSILIQYLTAINNLLLDLTLGPVLLLLFALLVAVSVGYIFVALGAKKLQKIEEV